VHTLSIFVSFLSNTFTGTWRVFTSSTSFMEQALTFLHSSLTSSSVFCNFSFTQLTSWAYGSVFISKISSLYVKHFLNVPNAHLSTGTSAA